jgi:hypothetical protein
VSKVGTIKASKAPPNPYSNVTQTSNDRNRVRRDFFKMLTPKEPARDLSLKVKPCDLFASPSRSESTREKQTKVLNYIIHRAKYDEKLNSDLFKAL